MNIIKKYIIYLIFFVGLLIILYNSINNNSIRVVKQKVVIKEIPEEFDGFTILQISDLHEKTFGKGQKKLIDLINEQAYDIIAITGDMQNRQSKNYDAFIELIKGIEKKDKVYYVPGNHGPYLYKLEEKYSNILKDSIYRRDERKYWDITEAGKLINKLGINYLDNVYKIKIGDSVMWISQALNKDEFAYLSNNEAKDNDIKIALTHYPISEKMYNGEYGSKLPSYDLVLAGNNHGGQWRIPFYGAVYITDIYGDKWFPEQDRVSGLTEWNGFKQYVSRGLGASSNYRFLRFRLFNKPEINLITLVKE